MKFRELITFYKLRRWVNSRFSEEIESQKQMMKFVDVKNDVAFRKIFGDKKKTKILLLFLNAVSKSEGDHRIEEVSTVNPYQFPRIAGEKASIKMYVLWIKKVANSNYLICSSNGVQHFSNKSINSPCCLAKNHKDGSTTYHHNMLCAALVHLDKREVFIMGSEPIIQQDGHKKNDCELNVTNNLYIKLSLKRVWSVMRAGRSRWEIENETFNTLKNLGYNFEHNYGHGQDHLSTTLAHLMLLAFNIDQFIQACSIVFRKVEEKIRTKIKLWGMIKSIFQTNNCESMEFIYRRIAFLFEVNLE